MSKKAKAQALQQFQQAVDDLLGLVGDTIGNDGLKNDEGWKSKATTAVTAIFGAEARMSKSARENVQGLMIEINTTAQEFGLPVPAQG